MTIIKKAPLMAFVLGLGLLTTMVTMNSFKGESEVALRYYYYGNQWNDIPPAPESGLSCQPVDITKICSAEFDSQPTTDNSVVNNPSAGAATFGVIQ